MNPITIVALILNLFFLESILKNPHYVVEIGLVLFLISSFVTLKNSKFGFFSLKSLKSLILPLLFLIGTILSLLLLGSHFLRQVLIFFYIFTFGIFQISLFDIVKKFSGKKDKEEKVKMHIRESFLVIATYFLITTGVLGFYFYLSLPFWQVFLAIFVVSWALMYYTLWRAGLIFANTWLYVLILGLVMVEVLWAISFWPVNFWVSAMVLVIIFYIFRGLVWMYLQKAFVPRLLKEYLTLGVVFLIILLATSRWTINF